MIKNTCCDDISQILLFGLILLLMTIFSIDNLESTVFLLSLCVKSSIRNLLFPYLSDGLLSPGATGTKAAGHASAPSFTATDSTLDEPTSTGDDFQPATWKPPSKSKS